MKSDPALDLILAQTKQNILFLVSRGALDEGAGALILGRLDLSAVTPQSTQGSATQRPTSASADPGGQVKTLVHEPPRYSEKMSSSPEAHTPVLSNGAPLFAVKALWGYNGDNRDEKDLSFRSGEIIEIIGETNADWWLGRLHGREGLLPSTYVEKPPVPPPRPSSVPMGMQPVSPCYQGVPGPSSPTPNGYSYPEGPSYPQAAPYYPSAQGHSAPSLPYGGYAPPQATPSLSLGAAQGQQAEQPKKHKFGNLGNTLVHSAAGGVGFGAGSAVGSGIIHSIF